MLESHVLFTSPRQRTNDFFPQKSTLHQATQLLFPLMAIQYVINLQLLSWLPGLKLTGFYSVMGDIGWSDPIPKGKNFFTPIVIGVS